ncbi:TonB-dependent receptor [Pseudoalteromonas sp. McH1-7]|uniref:TonB-dependent receptor domain-containing protein n=1 Tax=Pseudoalteromonas TaxID=53246 RepID=UPI0015909637|nr:MULTISPECIES: TonB-dependent receptor [Pseudoalteromonas]MDW7547399.1 TonB-dependent receptor [Pseudoalteromonas peptidolytica]NUZ12525.1 TonB-dependent receptor [Pseudoalteromonas sp. McH1-7]USD27947.1 TonB-dependent receptor [Pseudoalteromonas sp. SCSIO 43201]
MLKKLNLVTASIQTALVAGALSSSVAVANEQTEAKSVERIQVTGSRIKRVNLTSPTPVTVIGGVELENQGITNVNDLLAEMPQATVGLSPENTTSYIYASGLNTTDLRGLGSERTLVLVNGRRFVPGSVGDTAVDLNNIPTSIIERVEIATGGAAAVYGADAVAGVVNIITKKSFDGLEIDVSTVKPEQSGGEEYFFSITGGQELDKLSFITSLNYTKNESYAKMDRDFFKRGMRSISNPANTGGRDGVPADIQFNHPTALGYYSERGDFFAWTGTKTREAFENNHYTFDADGTMRPFDYGLGLIDDPNPLISERAAGRYTFDEANPGDAVFRHGYKDYFRTPLERVIGTLYGTYELNDEHALTFDATYSKTEATTESSPAFFSHTIRRDSAFVNDAMGKVMDDAGLDSVTLYQANEHLWGDREYNQEREVFRSSIGAEGIINDDWGYSTYFQFGRIEQDTLWTGEVYKNNLAYAIDSVVDSSGQVVCALRDADGNVTGAREGCVPFNPMGATGTTQAQLDYISTTATRFARHDQAVFGATVDGVLFELPAGYVSAAFTAEHRREVAKIRPSENMEKGLIKGNSSLPMDGEIEVKEFSAEISVPLLMDEFLATDLTLEGAYRYMDYSVTGGDDAWKLALNWGVTDELRIRLNRSKSVRAPNLGDLYTPNSKTFSSGRADVCRADSIAELSSDYKYRDNIINNCQAAGLAAGWMPSDEWLSGGSLPGYIQGNTDLDNEVSNDYTVGVIYTPEFVDGLDLTVDYWSFEIDGAIEYFGRNSVKLCYEASSLDNPFCGNFVRNKETGEIENYYARPINAAQITKKGMDFESAYKFDALNGEFALKLTATYLIEDNQNSTGRAEDFRNYMGETDDAPRWKGRFSALYSHDDSAYVVTVNYRHSTVDDNEWTPEDNNFNDVSSYTTVDFMYKTYLLEALQLRVGVNNVFDREPPRTPETYDNGEFFDVKGRRLSLGMKYNF